MADRLIPRAAINHFRASLMETKEGPIIVSAIDETLAKGFPFVEGEGSKRFISVRPPANDWEVLDVYVSTLKAYLITLPSCFQAAVEEINRDSSVTEVVISFPAENDHTRVAGIVENYGLQDLLLPTHNRFIEAVANLERLLNTYRPEVG